MPRSLIDALELGEDHTLRRPWGVMHATFMDDYTLKVIELNDGHRTSEQFHRNKDEVIRIVSGSGTVEGTPDDELGRPRPSPWYRISPGRVHRGVGPLLYVEVTTPEEDDVVRLQDDYDR